MIQTVCILYVYNDKNYNLKAINPYWHESESWKQNGGIEGMKASYGDVDQQ